MSDFFCPLPWIHQFIQTTGVKMCCVSNKELAVSPVEFANSDYIKDVRQTILDGKIPSSGCQHCVSTEAKGFASVRQYALKDFDFNKENIKAEIKYLDLRHSNLCNYSCRSCSPQFSTAITHELNNNPMLRKYYSIPSTPIYSNIVESLTPFRDSLTRINFTGGEPLLIKDNLLVLKWLISEGRTDVELLITTNCSTINPKILSLISQFDSVHWTLSIDGVGKIGEYIRNGSDWDTVVKNLEQIISLKQSILINTTVSGYCALDLLNLCSWFEQLKLTHTMQPLELMFSILRDPTAMEVTSLPMELMPRVKENLEKSITLMQDILSNPTEQVNNLQNLLILVNKLETTPSTIFWEFTNDFDQVRGQNFKKTFNIL
jgi:sulfatase maturation enzyme AslB (radical SAM superfamily)